MRPTENWLNLLFFLYLSLQFYFYFYFSFSIFFRLKRFTLYYFLVVNLRIRLISQHPNEFLSRLLYIVSSSSSLLFSSHQFTMRGELRPCNPSSVYAARVCESYARDPRRNNPQDYPSIFIPFFFISLFLFLFSPSALGNCIHRYIIYPSTFFQNALAWPRVIFVSCMTLDTLYPLIIHMINRLYFVHKCHSHVCGLKYIFIRQSFKNIGRIFYHWSHQKKKKWKFIDKIFFAFEFFFISAFIFIYFSRWKFERLLWNEMKSTMDEEEYITLPSELSSTIQFERFNFSAEIHTVVSWREWVFLFFILLFVYLYICMYRHTLRWIYKCPLSTIIFEIYIYIHIYKYEPKAV